MSLFQRPNLQFDASPMIADQMRPLIAKLVASDDDGYAYRCTIRHWLWSERPVIEGFAGKNVALHIEGPVTEVGPHRFPMGGVISGLSGWHRLNPIEANQLVAELRAEIDVTINRWLLKNAMVEPPVWHRPAVNRTIDDAQAIRSMIAWARREQQIEALNAAQV
jgi:hypothetical protein